MKIAILTIGNELLSGRTADVNSSFIAREINALGGSVISLMSVGDDEAAIKSRLHDLLEHADAVICTGGLGPTADDITTQVVAKAFDLPLVTDERALAELKDKFARYRLRWTDNNAKQARFPLGASVIDNPVGSAPGFVLRVQNQLVFVIPGVPSEARRMMPEGVMPILKHHFPEADRPRLTQTIKTFGLSEAAVDERLADIDFAGLCIAVGFYPEFPENHVVLTAEGDSSHEAQTHLQEALEVVTARLADHIFSTGGQSLEDVVAAALIEKKLTIACAESCTGGLIAHRLTNVPGSSAFFERGLITYANAAKTDLLGVPATLLERHGAVSEETARKMAEGVRKLASVDIGLSTTGIVGPSGGSPEKPVGTVYLALACEGLTICRHHTFRWDRARNKLISSEAALMLLYDWLRGKVDG